MLPAQTVVVTYAAMAIERMLAVKDRTPGQRPTLRLQKESLTPFLESLFTGLFAVREREKGGGQEPAVPAAPAERDARKQGGGQRLFGCRHRCLIVFILAVGLTRRLFFVSPPPLRAVVFLCVGDGPGRRERPSHEGGHAGAQLRAGEGPAHNQGPCIVAWRGVLADGGGGGTAVMAVGGRRRRW